MAADDYRQLMCVRCGESFTKVRRAGGPHKICDNCSGERDNKPGPVYNKQCVQCGKEFIALVQWAERCSRACNKAAWKARDPDRAQRQHIEKKRREKERLHAQESFQRRVAINRLITVLFRVRAVKSREERDAIRDAQALSPCDTCGGPLGQSVNGRARKHKYCCKECRDSGKVTKSIRRKASRKHLYAKVAATLEPFDPIDVLERDGWRCQICGVSTPRSRRGTNHFNAPEVDHVIPISKNGEHSMANSQCACKRCNGWKSNRFVVGQYPLFNHIDTGRV